MSKNRRNQQKAWNELEAEEDLNPELVESIIDEANRQRLSQSIRDEIEETQRKLSIIQKDRAARETQQEIAALLNDEGIVANLLNAAESSVQQGRQTALKAERKAARKAPASSSSHASASSSSHASASSSAPVVPAPQASESSRKEKDKDNKNQHKRKDHSRSRSPNIRKTTHDR